MRTNGRLFVEVISLRLARPLGLRRTGGFVLSSNPEVGGT